MIDDCEEMYDIVDENDRVLYQAPRSRVHAERLIHRAVHVWVFNAKGEILLQKRSATKDSFPNTWTSSVCGHVNAGEAYLQAAHREVEEEIGIHEPIELTKLAYVSARPETFMEFTQIYRASCEGGFCFPEEEISELRWFSPLEVNTLITEQPETCAPLFGYLWKL